MKHMAGGFGLGFLLGLLLVDAGEHKPTICTLVGICAAAVAWGFLP